MDTRGRHVIMEFWDCNDRIWSAEAVEAALREAVEKANVTLLQLVKKVFKPQGMSAVALISESHFSVHTWPEEGYIALDVYTCGEKAIPEAAVEVFKRHFTPKRVKILEMERGRWP